MMAMKLMLPYPISFVYSTKGGQNGYCGLALVHHLYVVSVFRKNGLYGRSGKATGLISHEGTQVELLDYKQRNSLFNYDSKYISRSSSVAWAEYTEICKSVVLSLKFCGEVMEFYNQPNLTIP